MNNFVKFYENALSDPHSFVFVLIGYFIVLGACFYTSIKTLKEIVQYRKQIEPLTTQRELPEK